MCAEAFNPDEDDEDTEPRVVHPKTDEQRCRLQEACRDILLFKTLDQVGLFFLYTCFKFCFLCFCFARIFFSLIYSLEKESFSDFDFKHIQEETDITLKQLEIEFGLQSHNVMLQCLN